jgi:hypothetical protein
MSPARTILWSSLIDRIPIGAADRCHDHLRAQRRRGIGQRGEDLLPFGRAAYVANGRGGYDQGIGHGHISFGR